MSDTMILVLSNSSDTTTGRVVGYLHKQGANVVRLNTDEFPEHMEVSLHFRDGTREHTLVIAGERVPLESINAIWVRRPSAPRACATLKPDDRGFAERESAHVLRGIWHLLKDRLWVNPRLSELSAEHKPYQLALAADVGFDIPKTLITNSPAEALQFFERCESQIIFKALGPYYWLSDGRFPSGLPGSAVYTNVVNRDDLMARADSIRHAPCIFQECIPKASELRVTVVGQRMLAAEILSQRSERSRHDWRRYDLANTPYRQYELPTRLRDLIASLMGRFGLVFACLDLILTPGGHTVFLEINPNGQWLWVQELTGLPIAESIGDLLIQGDKSAA